MSRLLKLVFVFSLISTVFLVEVSSQSIVYVNASSDCPGDGTSWASAYCNLQDAIQAAVPGTQIWVAAGTYYPDDGPGISPGSRTASFQLKNGVEIYGGFGGFEDQLDQRDFFGQNLTILSGNIGNQLQDNDNSHTVVNASNTDRSAVLDGFIVRDGRSLAGCGWANPDCSGANIFILTGSPTLRNLIVINGHASYGGGLSMLYDSDPLLENIGFDVNHGSSYGGAVHIRGNCRPEFYNCFFLSNTTANHGAAIHCRESNDVFFENCVFSDNISDRTAGAIVIQANSESEFINCQFLRNSTSQSSGAIHYNDRSSGIFRNCVFRDNHAEFTGGALGVHDRSSAQVYDCTFEGNSALISGGAIRITRNSEVEITNTQISSNSSAVNGGAVFVSDYSSLFLGQGIIDGNISENDGGGIYLEQNSNLDLSHSSLTENTASNGGAVAIALASSASIDSTFFAANTSELYGGAIYSNSALGFSLTGSVLEHNFARSGGGIYLTDNQSAEVNYCYIFGNTASADGGGLSLSGDRELEMLNCQITGNKSDIGAAFSLNDQSRLEAVNITVAANMAEESGGAFNLQNLSTVDFINSISYGNLALNGLNEIQSDAGSEFNAFYSCVKNDFGDIGGQGQFSPDSNTIESDPLFVDPVEANSAPDSEGNFSLLPHSPAINSGNNDFISGVNTDLSGSERILQDIVDMGAFEQEGLTQCEETKLIEICPGDHFKGIAIYKDTTIIDQFTGSDGCDSIIQYVLSLKDEEFLGMSNARDTILSSHIEDCDKAYIVFEAQLEFCGPETDMEPYAEWKLDLHHTGTFDFGSSDPKPDNSPRNNLILNEYLPFGTHLLEWTFESPSGQTITEQHLIKVVDHKQPTPVCHHGIAAAIMPSSGMLTLPAFLWDRMSWDNCTEGGDLIFSFSSDPAHQFHTWTCEDLDGLKERNIPIEIWVTDESGNQDYCNTYILLQDNQDSCPGIDDLTYSVSGLVLNPENIPLNEVYFTVEGENNFHKNAKNLADGSFLFELQEDRSYQISGHRKSHPMDGISTMDIILIQKHILGIQPLDNLWCRIAADVNNDFQINVLDLQLLRKHILGNLNPSRQFPQWKIIPHHTVEEGGEVPEYQAELAIRALEENKDDLVFRAVKMGDVNASHRSDFSERSGEEMPEILISLADQNFEKGELVKIAFKTGEVENILGLQAKISFDPGALEFYRYNSPTLPLRDHHFGFGALDEGSIYLSWNAARELEVYPETGWLELEFIARTDGTLSNHFYPGMGQFTNEIYISENSHPLEFTYRNSAEAQPLVSTARPFPNPFTNHALIPFKLSSDATIEIEITDVSGRKIFSTSGHYRTGSHELTVDRSMVPQAGVYLYSMKTKETRTSGKLIVLD